MIATARDVLEAGLELEPDEREHVAQQLLASLGPSEPDSDEDSTAEVVRRARQVREGRVCLVDGPASLRAIRDRLQGQ